jgi:hypothetical protein
MCFSLCNLRRGKTIRTPSSQRTLYPGIYHGLAPATTVSRMEEHATEIPPSERTAKHELTPATMTPTGGNRLGTTASQESAEHGLTPITMMMETELC